MTYQKQILHVTLSLNSTLNDNGLIRINGELEGESKYKNFRVVSFDDTYFNVYYRDKSTDYYIKIRF